jgi:ABC-type Co2+ transport system permease subunit
MTGQDPGKTAAIILGGIAGVAFLVIFLLFARNLTKKHNGMYELFMNSYVYILVSSHVLILIYSFCNIILSSTDY